VPTISAPGVTTVEQSRRIARAAAIEMWGLTARQCDVVEFALRYGMSKVAANRMGISARTFETHFAQASRRMGIKGAPHMLVAWDRLGGGRETLEVRRHVKG
jgi:FixJ family two-component response regulator